jgi:hypothetical protein
MTNVLKKAFTWSVVAVTLLWSVGFAAFAPMIAQAVECPELEAGDLFKSSASSAVYVMNEDMEALSFSSEALFKSWGFDFADVTVLSPSCVEVIDLAGSAYFAQGSLISRFGYPTVYFVGEGATITAFENTAALTALFGANPTVKVVYDSIFSGYDRSEETLDGTVIPDGMLVKKAGSTDVYYAMDGMLYAVEGSLPAAWAAKVRTVSATLFASVEDAGDSLTSADLEMYLDDMLMGSGSTDGGSGSETPATGSLSVSLSGSTPDSSNVVINADNITFSKFVLSNGSSSDVKVNSVRIVRKGLGATGNITSVTLYDGSTKLGESRTSWTSDDYMTYSISGGWTIPAGSAKTLTVVAKLGTAGTYNALGISQVTTASGATVSGLPVYGNEMQGVNVSVGTVTVTGRGASSVTREIGATDSVVSEFRLALSSVEDAKFHSITLKNEGTASDKDATNFYLKKGSTVIAGPAMMESDEVAFVLDEAYAMEKSKSYDFKVVADIVDGDARTLEFVLDASSDLAVVGNTYNTNLTVTRTDFDAVGDSGTTAVTVDGAELNLAFTSTAKESTDDSDDVELGRLTLSAGGTDVEISSLVFTVDEVDGNSSGADNLDIDELELVDTEDGTAYAGVMTNGGDANASDETWTYDDNVYLESGVSRTFIIRGDLPDGIGDGDQYRLTATINTTNVVAETKPAGDTVDNFSVSSYTGQFLTIRTPYLKVRSTAANDGSAVAASTGVELYTGSLEAVAGEITVEDLTFVGANASASNTSTVTANFDEDNWTDLYFYVKQGSSWVEVDHLQNGDLGDGTFTFDGFSEFVVKPGSTNKVEFKVAGTLESTLTGNTTVHLQLQSGTVKDADGDDASLKNSAGNAVSAVGYPVERTGTVTLTDTGILYVSMRNNDAGYNKDRFVLAGESAFVGKLRLKVDYEAIRIEDLVLTNASANDEDSTATVCLYKAAVVSEANLVACSTLDDSQKVTFDNINVTLPQGNNDWYVYVTTNAMNDGSGTADSADAFSFRIAASSTADQIVAYGDSSGDALSFGNNNGTSAGGEIVFDTDLDGSFDEAGDTTTAYTKTFTVAGSKITDISLVPSYGGQTVDSVLTGGSNVLAILKITTAGNSNTDDAGTDLRLALTKLDFDVTKFASTTINSATIQRINGVSTTAATLTMDQAASTNESTSDTAGGWALSTVTGSAYLGDDALIDAGDTAYFVVKANVTLGTGQDWVQVGLSNIDSGASGTANVQWNDGYDLNDASFYSLLIDKSSLDGTKALEAI